MTQTKEQVSERATMLISAAISSAFGNGLVSSEVTRNELYAYIASLEADAKRLDWLASDPTNNAAQTWRNWSGMASDYRSAMDRAMPSAPNVGSCKTCEGCGQIASDADGTPWKYWAGLPSPSNLAVKLGTVKPLPCPSCAPSTEEVSR